MLQFEARNASRGNRMRLLIIDDDASWCQTLSLVIRSIGHLPDEAHSLQEAQQKLVLAEEQRVLYAAAFIDMNFEMKVATGSGELKLPLGHEAIRYIKTYHSSVACIMVSGEAITPDQVLDLRDEFDLDYYIPKDRLEILDKALRRAIQRVESKTDATSAAAQTLLVEPSDVRSLDQPAALSSLSTSVTLDFHYARDDIRITWRADLIGRETTMFTLPYREAELPLVIKALDVLQYPNYPVPSATGEYQRFAFDTEEQVNLNRLGLWRDGRIVPQAHQIVGSTLHKALGTDGQKVLKTIRNTSSAQRAGTSFVLRFPAGAVQLAALPWELLWDAEKNQPAMMWSNALVSCERYIDIDAALPPPRSASEKLRVLALSPEYGIPSNVRAEEQDVRRKVWDDLKEQGKIDYQEISPLTMHAINDYLFRLEREYLEKEHLGDGQPVMSAAPDIVHYFGHGTYRDSKGYLVFDDGRGGKDLVPVERLAQVLGDVRLFVIHACQSAMVDEIGGLLTGVAPALSVDAGAVVAMQLTVRITAAMRFAEVFYDQLLGQRRSLQVAVARARRVLFTEMPDGTSWYVPTLYIRSRDQQPFYIMR